MTALRYKDPTTGQWVDIEIGGGTSIWSGTQAEYDAIPVKDPAVLYVIEGEGGVSWMTEADADARYARTTGVEGDFHVPGAVFVGSEAALMGAPDGGAQIVNEDVTGLDTLRVAAPTDPNHAVTKQYADANYINVAGDTMRSDLVVPAGSSFVPGGWVIQENRDNADFYIVRPGVANALVFNHTNGLGTVIGNPTAELGIATKQYVDSASPRNAMVDLSAYQAGGFVAATVAGMKLTSTVRRSPNADAAFYPVDLAAGIQRVRLTGLYLFVVEYAWAFPGDGMSLYGSKVLPLTVDQYFDTYYWVNSVTEGIRRTFGGVRVNGVTHGVVNMYIDGPIGHALTSLSMNVQVIYLGPM